MLKILNPDSLRDTDLLAKMHQLRYKVFVKELGWKSGISAINQLEFDEYDHSNTFYLVDVNEQQSVNAAVRLTQTIYPNVLLDTFSENISLASDHRNDSVVEISRFCSDKHIAPANVMGNIIAGLLELGLHKSLNYYVSFSNMNIKRRSEHFGWPVQNLGPIVKIDRAYVGALKHDVDEIYYKQVYNKLDLTKSLFNFNEIDRCPIKQNHIT